MANGSIGPAEFGRLPGAEARATTNQTFTNGTSAAVQLDTQEFDTGNLYTAPGDTIEARRKGTYLVVGHVNWHPDSDGARHLAVTVNGSPVEEVAVAAATSPAKTHMEISGLVRLTAGADVGLSAIQTAGNNLDTTIQFTNTGSANLALQWLGP